MMSPDPELDVAILVAYGLEPRDYAALVSDAEHVVSAVEVGEYVEALRVVVFWVCWIKWCRACESGQ